MANTFNPVAAQTPASNTAAVCTMTAVAGEAWCITSIGYSYSGTPTAGSLTIAWTDSTGTYSEVYYISGGGPGVLSWTPGVRRFAIDVTVTVTLSAGGSGVSGSVYPQGYTGK